MNSMLDDATASANRTENAAERRPRTETVCVVGLGYVGLPLAVGFDRVGHSVVGYDIDDRTIGTLREGVDTTGDLGDEAIGGSDVVFTSDPAKITRADYVMITVPTPVDENDHPNLDFVESAGRTVGAHMTPGTTVILESTVYPGATEEVLVPALETTSGLTRGEEFNVAYSPERATPGDAEHGLSHVVKVVGAADEDVLDDVASLYGDVIDAGVHRVPSLAAAEATKVVENVQRDVNIALMNELAIAFERMDLDVDIRTVLEAAGTKWNFHDYRPGLVGGHCIPVDPYFLAFRSKREGFVPQLTLASRDVNESMPEHVSDLVVHGLNDCGKPLAGSRVLVLGLTYKPDVADIRTSKIGKTIDRLREFDIDVVGYDPHADDDAMRAAFGVEIQSELSFDGFDGVVLATSHAEFEALDVGETIDALADDPVFVDVGGALDAAAVTERDALYRSI